MPHPQLRSAAVLGLALGLAVVAPVRAQDKNLGRNLAAQCANCHGTNGNSQAAIPSLAGRDKGSIVSAMDEFKTGKRTGPQASIMHQIAKGYTDAQIVAMAEFFAAQKTK